MLIFLGAVFLYLKFCAVLFLSVLLPGYYLTKIFITPEKLSLLAEKLPKGARDYFKRYFYFIFAPATGLVLIDGLMIILSKWGVTLNFWSLLPAACAILVSLYSINRFLLNPKKDILASEEDNPNKIKKDLFFLLFAVIWLLTVGLRIIFYLPDVLPQDTDLGHHMYFSENIILEGQLPEYDTSEVIVGEHLIFAFLSILSGVGLLSAMPLIILAGFNLMMILSLTFFSFLLTGNKKIALLTMALVGIYYAIDPPQSRYANGGVVGNTLGNYFICLIFILAFVFYAFWLKKIKGQVKAGFSQAMPAIISLLFFLLAGILYTHHLSSFLLLINLLFFFLFWLGSTLAILKFDVKNFFQSLVELFAALFRSPQFYLTIIILALFPLYFYLPFYLEHSAVETVARAPLKESHMGIEWSSLPGKFGWLKILFAGVGLALTLRFFSFLKGAMVFSWFLPLFLLSFFPQIFNISIPSRRVATYLIFPLTILAAYGLNFLFKKFKRKMRKKYFWLALIVFGGIFIFDGTTDFRSSYSASNKFQETVELFEASKFLAEKTSADSVMLKDHSTLAGDSWIKFFLQRGYDYFISRTYDYKYETLDPYNDTDPCPREMITVPESQLAKACYGQTQTNYVILKPEGDEFLFWKSGNFDLIYSSNTIAVFRVKSY